MRKLFSRAIGVVVAAAMLGSSFSGSVNALDTETSGYGSTEMTAAEEEPVYPENPQSEDIGYDGNEDAAEPEEMLEKEAEDAVQDTEDIEEAVENEKEETAEEEAQEESAQKEKTDEEPVSEETEGVFIQNDEGIAEEAPDTEEKPLKGNVYFVIGKEGYTLSFYEGNMEKLTASRSSDDTYFTDQYGNTAELSEGSVTISDNDGKEIFFGDDEDFTVYADGTFALRSDGKLYAVRERDLEEAGEKADFYTVSCSEEDLSFVLSGEQDTELSFSISAQEGYKAGEWTIPSDADLTETENGYSGRVLFYGKEQSEGNTCRFSFEKDEEAPEEKAELPAEEKEAEEPAKEEKTEEITVETGEEETTKEAAAAVHVEEKNISVTCDANGNTFEGGGSTNVVTYHVPEFYISKTPNLSDAGDVVSESYPGGQAVTDTVTIDGAEKLYVTITYQTQGTGYDWVCVYDGTVTPSASNYGSSISRKLGGTTRKTAKYTITGDTVQFFFKSNDSYNAYYGYYATISTEESCESELAAGEYKTPVCGETEKFLSWNTAADGTGITVDPENYSPIDDTTLYAQYRSIPASSVYNITFDANVGQFENGETTNTVAYTIKKSRSPNVNDSGVKTGPYPDNYEENDVITIDGAEDIFVRIKYGTDSAMDWVSIYKGDVTPSRSNYNSSLSKKLYGSENTKEYTIEGDDTAQFFFATNGSRNDYYGYFAEIAGIADGELLIPQKVYSVMTGWNTEPDGTGETIDPEKYIWTADTTLYAQYSPLKEGILFEDGTFVVKDSSAPTDDYIAEHGRVVEAYTDIEHNLGKFGGDRYLQIKKIIFDTDIKPEPIQDQRVGWFMNLKNLTDIENIERVDVSSVKNMGGMFMDCSSLTKLDLNSWDTSGVEDLNATFVGCSSLTSLKISDWDTSKVRDLTSTFNGCSSLKSLNIRRWDTGNLQTLDATFAGCTSLKTLNIRDWNTSKLTRMASTFSGCESITTLDLSGWDTSRATVIDIPFAQCKSLKTLNINGWDFSRAAINFSNLFASTGVQSQQGIKRLYARNITIPPSVTNLNVSAIPFTYADLTGWNTTNIKKVTFGGGKFDTLVINEWDTRSLEDLSMAFGGCQEMKSVVGIGSINTSNLKNTSNMFASCMKMEQIDLSKWDTGRLENASGMFGGCSSLEKVRIGTWNTESLKNLSAMFSGCSSLTSIDLSNWDMSSAENMTGIFSTDAKLETLILGEKFKFKEGQGGTQSLLYPDWVHVDTGTEVADLWNNYDAENLPGTYRRINMLTELTKDNINEIEFDEQTGLITVYVDTDKNMHPADVDIMSLWKTIQIHPELVSENSALAGLLENAVENGTYEDLDLKLTFKARTYADISSCSYSDSFIWTFDVPKENTAIIRTDIYKCDGSDRTYAGYIINSVEAPEIFTQYDASGNAIETLQPGARHTYGDIGFRVPDGEEYGDVNGKTITSEIQQEYVYPEYEEYLSYNRFMNNYEVVTAPGKYVFETTTPSATEIALTPVSPGTDGADGEINPLYTFTSPDSSDYAYMTMFNQVKVSEPGEYNIIEDSYGRFVKRDAVTRRPVQGAVYKFTGKTTGDVAYGKTDYDGLIKFNSLYKKPIGEDNNQRYSVVLYETYVAEEISSPEGYYTNPETVEIIFWIDHTQQHVINYSPMIYSDGISDTKDGTERNGCTTCNEPSHCLCGDYGRCRCNNCGTPNDQNYETEETIYHSDQPWPELIISKKDTSAAFLPGAVLQLIDKETNNIVDEWTTDDGVYTHRFNMPGKGQVPYGALGKTFIIREKTAPGGYRKADDIEVNISYTSGKVSRTMTDEYDIAGIKVRKTVTGNMGDRTKQFGFTMTLKNADNTPYSEDISYIKGEETGELTPDENGVISFTLAHGEEIELVNLKIGTKYSTAENDYTGDGYTAAYTNASGTIAMENPDVEVTNSRDGKIPTGIDGKFPFGVMAAAAFGTACMIIYRKKKRI